MDSKKKYGPNFDVPVGYYTELSDVNGQHLEEFLVFDWSMINYNISYHIERINKVIPPKYFKRNIPEYKFVSYVSHIISSFQGRQFDIAIIFVKRSLDYLAQHERKQIDKKYLDACLELFKGVYHFIKNEELVDIDWMNKFKIKEKIKMNS